MAGDWIKMRANLRHDPAVIGMAHSLQISENEVVGLLHSFWSWVDQHSTDGSIKGVTFAWIDRFVERAGFAHSLKSVQWLEGDDGALTVPNFERHNGSSAKKRAQATTRQQKSRSGRDKSVTREEKSREEKKRPRGVDLSDVLGDPEFADIRGWGDEFLRLWAEWALYRKERNLPKYVESSLRATLKKAQKVGFETFEIAIHTAIANNWQGVFPREKGSRKDTQGSTGGARSKTRGDYPEPERTGPATA